MTTFVTSQQWSAIGKDLTGRREPVIAVVAYVGTDGDRLMPLREGDQLVCDASDEKVRMGSTNVATLRRFVRSGVLVYNIPRLHAKVVVGSDFAWVGSANASDSGLFEATVRLGPTAARPVMAWARQQCQAAYLLTEVALDRLAQIPVIRRSGRRPIVDAGPGVIADMKRLTLLWMAGWADEDFDDFAEKDLAGLKSSGIAPRGISQWVRCGLPNDYTPVIREGDWILPIRHGHPGRPAVVERITPYKKDFVLWFRPMKTRRRPTQAALGTVIPRWDDWGGDEGLVIRSPRVIAKIRELYQ